MGFVGTHKGAVMVFNWPFVIGSVPLCEVQMHTQAISHLAVCQHTGVVYIYISIYIRGYHMIYIYIYIYIFILG